MDFITENWKAGVEILIIWIVLYQIYRAFKATRGLSILVGVVMIFTIITSLAYLLDLEVVAWILVHTSIGVAFTMVIIFQPEIRMALSKIGSARWFNFSKIQKLEFAEELTDAVAKLSHKRIGALLALERNIALDEYAQSGVKLDSEFSPELALTIFFPKTALHDGGVILSKNRIASAGCVFPLSQNEMSDRTLGLRHRAAVGLTEETDAVAIIVSEETGTISLAVNGELERNLKKDELHARIEKIFLPEEELKEEQDEEEEDSELDSEDNSIDSSDSNLVSD